MIELEHHLSTVVWNVGCVVYIFWIGGECLINFINMMIWRDNAINVAPVWCDISEYCHSPNRQQVLTRHLNQQHILKLHQTELFLLHHL